MVTAGYSSTPLLKKLGVKEGMQGLLIDAPATITELNAFDGWRSCKRIKTLRGVSGGPYDYIHCFCADASALDRLFPALKRELNQQGILWVSWPKKTSKVLTTVDEHLVRRSALQNGLVDTKKCAVDLVWSGLKLVVPLKDRK